MQKATTKRSRPKPKNEEDGESSEEFVKKKVRLQLCRPQERTVKWQISEERPPKNKRKRVRGQLSKARPSYKRVPM